MFDVICFPLWNLFSPRMSGVDVPQESAPAAHILRGAFGALPGSICRFDDFSRSFKSGVS
jgi:hypothetical protein